MDWNTIYMVKERIVHFQFPSNSTFVWNHNSKYFLQYIFGLFSITIIYAYNNPIIFQKIMRLSLMANITCTST